MEKHSPYSEYPSWAEPSQLSSINKSLYFCSILFMMTSTDAMSNHKSRVKSLNCLIILLNLHRQNVN
ncbi:CLUMA_CG001199, isoform A [Clunio marinus]|uniref:CLUMA_CG001199, isoform A n=1 Tax=Clunio marinus TaxID=568069 RepID=A0A1J1HHB5_9DIPT|nr:CLUMA_CG001199, isoform A [Clunio marinus]